MDMDRVVTIWLDGFPSRYIDQDNTPFIAGLADAGVSLEIEPLFAFAGIGVSAFTGTNIDTHKTWTDYVYRRRGRMPSLLKRLLKLCDLLPGDTLNAYARYAVTRGFGVNPGTPNIIPIELVDFFETKEQKRLTSVQPFDGIPTLFDELRRNGVSYHISGFYESIFEGALLRRTLRALDGQHRFILVRLGSTDRVGHRYGPDSDQVRSRLRAIDGIVRDVTERSQSSTGKSHIVLFSDHGMVPVSGVVDLLGVLRQLPARIPEDYTVFINSTVACFWFNSDQARETITGALGQVKQGILLDEAKRTELGIDGIGAEYGHLLFALKQGNVFFPDFYRRRKPPKGMHGYAFASYDSPPLLVYSPGVSYDVWRREKARFVDVMPTILHLLGLPLPATCEGRSILDDQVGDVGHR